jgi:lipopolysaccharide export LptBFGC system permease protein LptF
MRVARLDAMNVSTLLSLLLGAAFFYSAWLTSIVFCAASGRGPLLVASAMFFPVGVVHGIGVWFGGW